MVDIVKLQQRRLRRVAVGIAAIFLADRRAENRVSGVVVIIERAVQLRRGMVDVVSRTRDTGKCILPSRLAGLDRLQFEDGEARS